MDIQTEVQKIHHQFGVSEKANYEIQKLFDKAIKEAVTEALCAHDVVGRSEQLKAFISAMIEEFDSGGVSWETRDSAESILKRL